MLSLFIMRQHSGGLMSVNRGDVFLFKWADNDRIEAGELVLYERVKGSIPILHRVVRAHER